MFEDQNRLKTNFSGLFPNNGTSNQQNNTNSSQLLVFGEPEMDFMEMDDGFGQDVVGPAVSHVVGGSSGRRQRRNSQQQRPHHKGPLFGISPSFGAAPIEGLLPSTTNSRRRHCSLEEELLDESSSSSHGSCGMSKQGHAGSGMQHVNKVSCDLNPGKSFMNGSHSFLPFSPSTTTTTSPAPPTSSADNYLLLEEPYENHHHPADEQEDEAPFGLDVVSDPHLLLLRSSLVAEFEMRLRALVEARATEFFLDFPEGLLAVIASHVLQEAEMEPYGLKGCVLRLQYEGQTALHTVGTLHCGGNDVTPTFGVTVTLRQAQVSWGQRMARRLSFSSSPPTLSVSTSYKLVKKRTYRPNEEISSETKMLGK